jgi:hypothetical protein
MQSLSQRTAQVIATNGVNTMYTTEQIIHAITTAGCLGDLEHNLEIGNVGGVKFIIRACLNISLADSGWITFDTVYDLHKAISATDEA